MNYESISDYADNLNKLESICAENNLVCAVRNDRYPFTIVIKPLDGVGEQLNMLGDADENSYMSADAVRTITIVNSLIDKRTDGGRFTMAQKLEQKIDGLCMKIYHNWLDYKFALSTQANGKTGTDTTAKPWDVPDDGDTE